MGAWFNWCCLNVLLVGENLGFVEKFITTEKGQKLIHTATDLEYLTNIFIGSRS